jgi:hypothetical protein
MQFLVQRTCFCAAALLLLLPTPTRADVLLFTFGGQVSGITDPNHLLGGHVAIGDPVVAELAYRTDARDQDPDPGRGIYSSKPGWVAVEVNGSRFYHAPLVDTFLVVVTTQYLIGEWNRGDGPIVGPTFLPGFSDGLIAVLIAQPLSSDEPPSDIDFPNDRRSWGFVQARNSIYSPIAYEIVFDLDRMIEPSPVIVPVPEPAITPAIGAALVVLSMRVRSRRRRT